jgi:hypothetical protein
MENVTLVQGECSMCGAEIPESWADKNPPLGTTCQDCWGERKWLFGVENISFQVSVTESFDPVFDIHEYHFDFKGTTVMVNDKVGTIWSTQGDLSWVHFEDDEERSTGTPIKGLGYEELLRSYEATGAVVKPPATNFEPHQPEKVDLLEKPILAVHVRINDDGNVSLIEVGSHSPHGGFIGGRSELQIIPMLHAFCNLYVRYKFGLALNLVMEGGFLGKDFEVRNAGVMTGGCGLKVRMNRVINDLRSVTDEDSFRTLAKTELLVANVIAHEQSRTGVIQNADAELVLSTWVNTMETLLKYDWTEHKLDSVEAVWSAYCKMQDIMANILPTDELVEAFAYPKGGEMRHYGAAY